MAKSNPIKTAPDAGQLCAMLEALVAHREARRKWWRELAVPKPLLKVRSMAEIMAEYPDGLPPCWYSHVEAAIKDPIEESLHASIREEGWRAFATDGLKAMHELCDALPERFWGIVDHRWDGIGTKDGGYWIC